MTEKEFRHKLIVKGEEYATQNATTPNEKEKLLKAYITGCSDYAYLTMECMGISKEEYKEFENVFKQFF